MTSQPQRVVTHLLHSTISVESHRELLRADSLYPPESREPSQAKPSRASVRSHGHMQTAARGAAAVRG
ncbi:hypothetical protein JOB18_005968 [Solea senegalensis]|uniref:Uncharacterized protein n=1 Tax=Solea senegalensis TaxID=28829 RepID=A0AAV6PFE6_SOLSE|nr:hypothetical protein JOB18_005968 [Solea senegalensis]